MPDLVQIRVAYGKALVELGAQNPNVVVLDADMASGTQTHFFRDAYPNRFFNVGIAEQNLIDVAAGFAVGGMIPFANTFASLLTLRGGEMIRTTICYGNMNVKIGAGYGGCSAGLDGPTHYAIEDMAVMRALPRMTVLCVSDAVTARAAVFAAAEFVGPVYLRLSRNETPIVHDSDFRLEIGRAVELRSGRDVALIGTGTMVPRCLDAADELKKDGISVRVLEVHTLKPIDEASITAAARETGALVTAEEHTIIGGLGGAVAEVLARRSPVPLEQVGIPDSFTETGPWLDVLEKYGMGVKDIVAAARKVLKRKG